MGDQSDWKTIGYGASRCVHNSGDRHWVGREAGTRENPHKVVINRNLPAGDFERDAEARWEPLSQPEATAVVDAVDEIGQEIPPTPGSFGSCFGRDRGMPVHTIEFRRRSDQVKDWQMIGNAVLEAIKGPIGG